ncbi:MAG: hypothetical protein RLP44_09800 [Aggregatilineales bacterium]
MYIDLNWFIGLYIQGTYKTLTVVILTLIVVILWGNFVVLPEVIQPAIPLSTQDLRDGNFQMDGSRPYSVRGEMVFDTGWEMVTSGGVLEFLFGDDISYYSIVEIEDYLLLYRSESQFELSSEIETFVVYVNRLSPNDQDIVDEFTQYYPDLDSRVLPLRLVEREQSLVDSASVLGFFFLFLGLSILGIYHFIKNKILGSNTATDVPSPNTNANLEN